MKNEIIKSIKEVSNIRATAVGGLNGNNGAQRGFMSNLNAVFYGGDEYDGYEIETSLHKYSLLISNGQSCCESWGYFSSDNDFHPFIGKTLVKTELTDQALNTKALKESGYYDGAGGIQFITFTFSDGGVLQFAVYNAHNGYYGHPILFAKDSELIHSDVL